MYNRKIKSSEKINKEKNPQNPHLFVKSYKPYFQINTSYAGNPLFCSKYV